MFEEMCRLCLSKTDLLWIFDERMAENMSEVIEATSGVKILKNDPITQMVCGTCCQITLKMFSFRTKSIKNDKDLKTRHAQYNITQLQNQSNSSSHTSEPSVSQPPPPSVVRFPIKYRHAHSSLKQIIKNYPNLKLPEIPMKSHFSPYITLLKDEVDEWFKDFKNLSKEQIAKLKAEAATRHHSKKPAKIQPYGPKSARKRSSHDVEDQPAMKKRAEDTSLKVPRKTNEAIGTKPEEAKKSRLTEPVALKSEPPHVQQRHRIQLPAHKNDVETSSRTVTNEGSDNGKAARRKHARKTTRPITYNEDLFIDTRLIPNSSEQEQPIHRKPILKNATTITANVIDPDTDSDDMNREIDGFMHSSPYSSRSSTPSIAGAATSEPKNDFARSLALTPRKEGTSMNDLFLSHRSKSQTLHTCKICDSHFYTTRDLKQHERKTHTKCMYCNKRFRSFSTRDEHQKSCDMLNNVPTTTKTDKSPRLKLQRVDELPEIRTKYATAFETLIADAEPEHVIVESVNPEVTTSDVPNIELVVRQLELELSKEKAANNEVQSLPKDPLALDPPADSRANGIPEKSPTTAEKSDDSVASTATTPPNRVVQAPMNGETHASTAPETNNNTTNNVEKGTDVICISDDDGEPTMNTAGTGKPSLNVTNTEVLQNVNLHETDNDILKAVITAVDKQRKEDRSVVVKTLSNNPITLGANAKTRIFNNLRRHLFNYKIPVEISYKPEMRVGYKYAKVPSVPQITELWVSKPAKDIRGIAVPTQKDIQAATAQLQMINHPSISIPSGGYTRPPAPKPNVPNNVANTNPVSTPNRANVTPTQARFNFKAQSATIAPKIPAPTTNGLPTAPTSSPIIVNRLPNGIANAVTSGQNFVAVAPSTSTPLPLIQGPLPVIHSVRTEPVDNGITANEPETPVSAATPHIRVRNLQELS